ncbi:TPA: glycosyltransferase family 2 protein [Streptococcus suis]
MTRDQLVKDLISIIMPAYNGELFIGKTIESVLNQSYRNWELIIVNDGSTDGTLETISTFCDSRIRVINFKKNCGVISARKIALEKATGQYIAFLDSDDIWYPEKLRFQIEFMKKNGYNFCCTSYEYIDESDNKLNCVVHSKPKLNYKRLLYSSAIGNSTVMYNALELGKVSIPDILNREDYALWLKILKMTPYIYGVPDILMQYRVRKGSLSRNKLNLIKYHYNLYRKSEKLSIFKSIFYTSSFILLKLINRR